MSVMAERPEATIEPMMLYMGRLAREAAGVLATASTETKNAALRAMAYANVGRIEREGKVGDRHTIVALYYGELIRKVSRAAFEMSGSAALELEKALDNTTW